MDPKGETEGGPPPAQRLPTEQWSEKREKIAKNVHGFKMKENIIISQIIYGLPF